MYVQLAKNISQNLKENVNLGDLDTEGFSAKTYLSKTGCGQC